MSDDAHDPELDPLLAAASAGVDDDPGPAEQLVLDGRATSAEMQALTDRLREVRTALALPLGGAPTDHDPVRDTAIAAALAEFDMLHSAAPVAPAAPSAPVVPIGSRLRYRRILVAAAAVAVVGVAGVAALTGGGSSSRDSARSAQVPEAADSAVSGALDTIDAINGPATAVPELTDPSQLLALSPAFDVGAEGGVTDTVPGPLPSGKTDSGTATPTVGPPQPALSFAFTCPLGAHQVILAEIRWQGAPAVAVRDTVTGVTQAVDPQCTVLATAQP